MPDAAYRVAIHTRIVTRKSRVAHAKMWELFRERGRPFARFDRFRSETSFASAFLAEALPRSRWMENSLPFTAEEHSRRMLITRREFRSENELSSLLREFNLGLSRKWCDLPWNSTRNFRSSSSCVISRLCAYYIFFLLERQMQSKLQLIQEKQRLAWCIICTEDEQDILNVDFFMVHIKR